MEQFETKEQWIQAAARLITELRTLQASINDRLTQIRNGTPQHTLARKHSDNKRTLTQLEARATQIVKSRETLIRSGKIAGGDSMSTQKQVDTINNQLREAQRLMLVGDGPTGNAGSIDRTRETEETRGMTAQEMMQANEQQINQQDAKLDQINNGLRTEIEKAKGISNTLDDQEKQIDRTSGKMDSNVNEIHRQEKKMDKLITAKTCIYYVIIVILLIVLIAQVASGNFTMGYPSKK